jgi:hypothetical protein
VADRYADGLVTAEELKETFVAARRAYDNAFQPHDSAAFSVTYLAAEGHQAASVAASSAFLALGEDAADAAYQAELLRHIIGNPFRPLSVDPSWLTDTVSGLARAIYEERAFERMPILADALEEAGCTNAEVLGHCRGPGLHVRGCWVVDLLLGKS